jgi:hypothetical protein
MSQRRGSRRLVMVWSVLAALMAVILYAERADLVSLWESHEEHLLEGGSRNLVSVPLQELGAVEIVHQGRVHRFERDAQKVWFYHGAHSAQQASHTHQSDPAAAARIDKALAAFSKTRIERWLSVDRTAEASAPEPGGASRVNAGDYGVTVPSMLILLYVPDQIEPAARYAVGDVAPDTYSRYIQRLGSPEVMTIANYQITNLQQLIDSFVSGKAQPAAAQAPDAPLQRSN